MVVSCPCACLELDCASSFPPPPFVPPVSGNLAQVRNQRNKFVTLIGAAKQAAAEMLERLSLLAAEQGVLQQEVAAKAKLVNQVGVWVCLTPALTGASGGVTVQLKLCMRVISLDVTAITTTCVCCPPPPPTPRTRRTGQGAAHPRGQGARHAAHRAARPGRRLPRQALRVGGADRVHRDGVGAHQPRRGGHVGQPRHLPGGGAEPQQHGAAGDRQVGLNARCGCGWVWAGGMVVGVSGGGGDPSTRLEFVGLAVEGRGVALQQQALLSPTDTIHPSYSPAFSQCSHIETAPF